MVRHSVCVFTAVIAVGLSTLTADGRAEQQTGFSPQTAAVFVKTAQEIVAADPTAIDAAMLFLDAAEALERAAARPSEQRLRIGAESCVGRTDYSEAMAAALRAYVGRQFDLEAALAALRCMLTRLDTRVDREILLDTLLRRYVSVSPWLGSELATQLGLLAAEKTDMDGAMERLNLAYHLNPYNQLAFLALQDVYAAGDRMVSAEAAAVQLRRMLDANPYDLGRSLRMANVLRQVELYPQAATMYEYTDRVFRYHYPGQTPGQSLYLPWMMSCYHSPRLVGQCLDLAERFRDTEVLDLKLEAAAGRAAAKLGRPEQARRILEQAAERAEQMLNEADLALPIWPEHLAWFYSFVLERPDHALAWSNQAFSQAPDRGGVRAIFAYTLAVNDQHELAAQYAEATAATEQAAAITMALVRRSQDQTQQAIDLLRNAIAMAPETFEAEKARSLLTDMGSEYLSPAYTQEIEKQLTEAFGTRMLLTYLEPRQRFAAKLQLSGGEVVYGAELGPRLVFENHSSAPLVIQDEAMLAGFIRVDAAVRRYHDGLSKSAVDAVSTQPADYAQRASVCAAGFAHRQAAATVDGSSTSLAGGGVYGVSGSRGGRGRHGCQRPGGYVAGHGVISAARREPDAGVYDAAARCAGAGAGRPEDAGGNPLCRTAGRTRGADARAGALCAYRSGAGTADRRRAARPDG